MRRRLTIWLQLQVLVATATQRRHDDNYTVPSVINVGLLQPLEGPFGFERTGSAATMAVRDAQQRGYLNNTDVKYASIHIISSHAMWLYFNWSIENIKGLFFKLQIYLPLTLMGY